MRRLFLSLVAMALGAVEIILSAALWRALKGEVSGLTPILRGGIRSGISHADPTAALWVMTAIVTAAFLASLLALFPGVRLWLKRRRDAHWPPAAERTASPPWNCPHCGEENPANFEECWNCQKARDVETAP